MTAATFNTRPFGSPVTTGTGRRAGRLAALASGALWVPFGVFQMLTPFGPHTRFDIGRNHDVVIDRWLYTIYSLPGSLALIAAGAALLFLSEASADARRVRVARGLLFTVMAMGTLGLVGIAVQNVPAFMATTAFGTPLLGVTAALLAGAAPAGLRAHLLVLGLASVAMIGLMPAVWAVEIITEQTGAVLIAVFGCGWMTLARPGRSPIDPPRPTP